MNLHWGRAQSYIILFLLYFLDRDLVLLFVLLDRLLEEDLPLFLEVRDRDLDLLFERFFDFFLLLLLRLLDLDRLEDELDELLDLLFPDFLLFLRDLDLDRDELELLEELDDRDRRERFLEDSLDLDLERLFDLDLDFFFSSRRTEAFFSFIGFNVLPLAGLTSSFFLSSSGSPQRSYLERSPSPC